MPFASYLQPFADPTEGHLSEVSSGGVSLSGLMVYGNRLYGTASIFYDANNTQRISHFSRALQLNQPSFSGWSQVSDVGRSGFVAGWMAAVPNEWQAPLGGPALTGQCCIPIVWRTSNGPAAFAFNPAQVGAPVVSATPLLYYTLDHATLGPWEGSNPTYGATTDIAGMAMVSGTRTVLYVGRNGLGPYCYGNGTSNQSLAGTYGADGALLCYDPTSSDKGSHAYPYRYQVWAYDLNDFAAVKAGAKQPWQVVPYGVWPLNFPTPEARARLSGVAYDAQRQLLYISQRGADPDGYASRPVIHAFQLNSSPGAITPPAPSTVSSVSLTADKISPQGLGTTVTFTAEVAGGVAPYHYKWLISNGAASTVVGDWTTSNRLPWTPAAENPSYSITVWVRSAGNTADTPEASASSSFTIAPAPGAARVTAVSLVANRVAPQPPLTVITWTATPVGGISPHHYKWVVSNGSTTSVAANWSTSNSFSWTPSTASANHRVSVWVRSAGNTADQAEAAADKGFSITAPPAAAAPAAPSVAPVSAMTLTSSKPSPQPAGTQVVFTAQAIGGVGPHQYQWWLFNGEQWVAVTGWRTYNTMAWSHQTAGPRYQVQVRVRSAGSTNDSGEQTATMPFVLSSGS